MVLLLLLVLLVLFLMLLCGGAFRCCDHFCLFVGNNIVAAVFVFCFFY